MKRLARGWMIAMWSSLAAALVLGAAAFLLPFLFDIVGDDEATFPLAAFLAELFAVLIAGAALCLSAIFLVMAFWRRGAAPGTCSRCGYPRAGLPADAPCPECGHAAGAKP